MFNKDRVLKVVSLLMIIGISFTGFVGCAKKAPETIKIGAILPLTGEAAQYGQWAKEGIDLALEEVNNQGGINGRQLEVIYEDDQANPKVGVSAMNKLVNVDKVPVVIGALPSSVTLAIAPIAESSKTVIISPGSSSPEITKAGDYVFRNWPSDIFEGRTMADFVVKNLNLKKVAIFHINNDYGLGVKNVFEDRFEGLGGTVSIVDTFEQGATDFRTPLTKISKTNSEAVYMPGHVKELAHILKQAKELGIKAKFLSTVGLEGEELIKIAGDAAEGVIYTAPAFDPKSADQTVAEYQAAYKAKYGKLSEAFGAHGYDTLKLVVLAIKRGGYSAEGIKNALYNIKNYPGVSGETTFDENGDVAKPAMVKVVKNGQFVPFENQ